MDTRYKYFPVNEFLFSTLINSEIWFSNPNNFNDPFDCNLKCQYLKDYDFEERTNNMLRNEFNSAISNESYIREHKIITSVAEAHEQKRKTKSEQINVDFESKVIETGISCFSKNNSSILMWSHYSNNHRGVCLKFNTSDRVFFDNCHQVKYVQEFPGADANLDVEGSHNFLFFTKSEEWVYEEEVRVIKNSNSLSGFEPDCLEAIYFGAKCKEKDIKTIMNLVEGLKKYDNISYYRFKLSEDSFRLESEIINN